MGVELILGVIAVYFGAIAAFLLALFAPTLLAVALKREGIFSIMGVNVLFVAIGWPFAGWVIALAWAVFGARRAPRPHVARAAWDILP